MRPDLTWTLADLHTANILRQEEWCPHQKPDLSFRGNELAGEVGEACNVIKKIERERHGWVGSRATKEQLAEELADVIICASLVAITAGVDLMAATAEKFNGTSEQLGFSTRLGRAATGVEIADVEWIARAAVSIADMVAEWYRGPARGDADIPVDLIMRRLMRWRLAVAIAPPARAPDGSAASHNGRSRPTLMGG